MLRYHPHPRNRFGDLLLAIVVHIANVNATIHRNHLSPASGNRPVFYKPASFLSIGGAMDVVDDFLQRPETYGDPRFCQYHFHQVFVVPDLRQPHRWLPRRFAPTNPTHRTPT